MRQGTALHIQLQNLLLKKRRWKLFGQYACEKWKGKGGSETSKMLRSNSIPNFFQYSKNTPFQSHPGLAVWNWYLWNVDYGVHHVCFLNAKVLSAMNNSVSLPVAWAKFSNRPINWSCYYKRTVPSPDMIKISTDSITFCFCLRTQKLWSIHIQ